MVWRESVLAREHARKSYTFEQAGLVGKMKLILMSRLPPANAALERDTPKNIERFKRLVTEITGKPAPNY